MRTLFDDCHTAVRAVILAVLVIAHTLQPAFALSTSRSLTQFGHTVWRSLDGNLVGSPTSFAQTTDGYLWIGSGSGLQRFDGVKFTSISLDDNGGRPRRPDVYGLAAASDGSLWVGASNSLVHWRGGNIVRYAAGGRIFGVVAGPDGDAWFTRAGGPAVEDGKGPLCHASATGVRCLGKSDGIPFPSALALAGDAESGFWFASTTTIGHWKGPSAHELYVTRGKGLSDDLTGINALAQATDGSIWVGMAVAGPGLGLQHIVDGRWQDVTLPTLVGSSLEVNQLLVDRQGALWVATTHDGLYRIFAGQAEHFGAKDGLSSDTVTALFEDAEGNVWVGTSRGLDRFRDVRVATFSRLEGLSGDEVQSVFARRNGAVVVGNTRQVDEITGTSAASLRVSTFKEATDATTVFEDNRERLWVGVGTGLLVIDHGVSRKVRGPDGGPVGVVIDMAQEDDGTMWVAVLGSPGRVLRIDGDLVARQSVPALPGSQRLLAAPGGGLWMATSDASLALYRAGELRRFDYKRATNRTFVQGLASAPDGTIYGSMGDGVVAWRGGKTRVLSSADGLQCSRTFAPVLDHHGNLWLYSVCGLMRVSAADMAKWWADPAHKVRARLFDVTDGVEAQESYFGTAASRSTDGRLWFANGTHLQMIDPDRISDNPVMPPVHVEALLADRKPFKLGDDMHLGTGVRDIQIDYTAPSFVAPQLVQFKYKLEGHDKDWQGPVSRRQAFYTDLAPGRYRFRVIAANNDGLWNVEGASLSFDIAPTFVQTIWFKVACILAALFVAAWAVHARVRRLSAQLQVRMDERERIARELHDTLLQSTQAVMLMFRSALEQLPAESGARRAIERAVDHADLVSAEGRDRIHGLRAKAATTTDLAQALELSGKMLGPDRTLELRVLAKGPVRALAAEVHGELYRMGSEALLNIFKHARASRAEVDVVSGVNELVLLVRDDGVGIAREFTEEPAVAGHWGLAGLRERARNIGAQVEIIGAPGAGTTVRVTVPAQRAYAAAAVHSGWLISVLRRR